MTTKHTPGPWRYEPATKTIRSVPTNYWLATMDSWDGAVNNAENARRIVACVYACEGVSTENVEKFGKAAPAIELERLRAVNAELVGALEQGLRYVEVNLAYRGSMTSAQVEQAIIDNRSISRTEIGANSCNTLASFDITKARAALSNAKEAK